MSQTNKHDKDGIIDILRDFLNVTLKDIMTALEAECGSLFLSDFDHKELVLESLHNSHNIQIKGLKQKIGEGISGKVVDIKTPVLVKDIEKDHRFRQNGFSHYHTKSFISIPLFSSKGLIGVINITDKANGEPFSDRDLSLAAIICKYACVTVETLINNAELKQQRETSEKQRLLLEKYASVGKLAAGIVHEVNNPLDGIIRYTNILLEQSENNSITREYLLEVKTGLHRIANITKSLLEFSHKVNSSSHTKNYVNLHDLIEESLDILKDKFTNNTQVNKKYNHSLPRILDFGLSSVVTNIIKNALEAMPSGGAIDISTDINDSSVEIRFKDRGPGIPEETMKHIFEPFFTTKSINKGAGLGLAICNEIIKKYEGRIDVASTLGKESSFTVLIPKKHLENAR